MNTNQSGCPSRQMKLLASLLVATGIHVPIATASASPSPVLLVIANQDFHYREYADTRAALQARGLKVVVAAGETGLARPQGSGPAVRPDLTLTDAQSSNYSAIVFVGGWGASSYQYAFEGTYHHTAYQQPWSARHVNRLIDDFSDADKPIAAICHGVTVLAWARVDGVSPLRGRVVVGATGGMPGFRRGNFDFRDAEYPARWQIEANGAVMLTSGSIGNPMTSADDVIVDGRIITAENVDSAVRFSDEIAKSIATRR